MTGNTLPQNGIRPSGSIRRALLATGASTVVALALAAPATQAAAAPGVVTPSERIVTGGPASYRIVDLGTLGGVTSRAAAINDNGQVVGSSLLRTGENWHAFLYSRGRMVDLGTLGGPISLATDLNDAGQVVGVSSTRSGSMHVALWQNGRIRDLGLAGTYGPALVNRAGHVVATLWHPSTSTFTVHLWRNGRWTTVPSRNLGRQPNVSALTDDDVILGGDTKGAFLLRPDGRVTRPSGSVDGYTLTRVADRSRNGTYVGSTEQLRVEGGVVVHGRSGPAVVWTAGRPLVPLPGLGMPWDQRGTFAAAVNDRGTVVGTSTSGEFPDGRATVWTRTPASGYQPSDLGVLSATPGQQGAQGIRSAAVDVNERGVIVGWASAGPMQIFADELHAVLWAPVW